MRVIDSITNRAGRIAGDVQDSLKRARVEGEKRLLQRQHRAALEDLGLRVYELVKAGDMPDEAVAAEVAAVEGKLIEIEAKVSEIESMRPDEPGASPTPDDTSAAPVDAALAAFPMIDENPPDERPESPPAR
jgi:hypothetical protein